MEQKAYRAYVTDALRLQGEGKYMAARWIEIIDQTPQIEDERPCVEIAANTWERIRGE